MSKYSETITADLAKGETLESLRYEQCRLFTLKIYEILDCVKSKSKKHKLEFYNLENKLKIAVNNGIVPLNESYHYIMTNKDKLLNIGGNIEATDDAIQASADEAVQNGRLDEKDKEYTANILKTIRDEWNNYGEEEKKDIQKYIRFLVGRCLRVQGIENYAN